MYVYTPCRAKLMIMVERCTAGRPYRDDHFLIGGSAVDWRQSITLYIKNEQNVKHLLAREPHLKCL